MPTDPAEDTEEDSGGFGRPYLLIDRDSPSPPALQSRSLEPEPSGYLRNQDSVKHGTEQRRDPQSPLPPSSPPVHHYSSPDSAPALPLSDLLQSSSPGPRRATAYSPLPPSSPPRDSTSPERQEEENLQPQENSSFGDQQEYDSHGEPISHQQSLREDNGTSFFESLDRQIVGQHEGESVLLRYSPNGEDQGKDSDEHRESTHSPELPIPGSGDSAYSNRGHYYTSPSNVSTYEPQQATDKSISRAVRAMASLARVYRSNLDGCQLLTEYVHSVKMDAVITRRAVTQEMAMTYRMNQWATTWDNPAKKWHKSALWKYPISTKIVGDKYVETSSDDDRAPPALKAKLTWNEDNVCSIVGEEEVGSDVEIFDESRSEKYVDFAVMRRSLLLIVHAFPASAVSHLKAFLFQAATEPARSPAP